MSLLELENISKEYRNQVVLDRVSLRVERGERVALVGPNGAGKTTLLRIAMGFETSDSGSAIIARNAKVGYLSQDLKEIESSDHKGETALHYEKVAQLERELRNLERKMAEQNKLAGSTIHKFLMDQYAKLLSQYEAADGYTIETKIKKVLLGLGLRQETLSTPLVSLSGGEKMRVSVARILLEDPDLLILDEPTNHFDMNATEWFEGFLKKFKGGILFVSHDRYFLDRVATRVAELEKGTLCVRTGNYSSYIEQKNRLNQFYSSEQRRLRWTIKNVKETLQGLKSRGKIRASKSREKEIQKLNEELKTGLRNTRSQEHLQRVSGPKIKFKQIRHVSKDIAWAEDLQKSFGEVQLFSGANFHIMGGERIGIIGPNGSGKSTLIKMLLGHDNDFAGFLRLGEWVKYSYMGQEVLFENYRMTMLDIVTAKRDMPKREAQEYLARFQFYGDEVNKTIEVLSGGEKVRLYLALVMLENADCLILDEPTNHLDVSGRDAVEAALKDFKGTIIAVTHDRFFLTHCVGKILEIENGKIATFEGNYEFYKQLKYGSDGDSQKEKAARLKEGPKKASQTRPPNSDKAKNQEKARQEIESQIIGLEEKIKEAELSFDQSTPLAKYKEYDGLLKDLDALYSKWDDLIN